MTTIKQNLDLAGCGFQFAIQTFAGDFWGDLDQPVLNYLRSQDKWDTFEQPFERICECPTYPDSHYKATDLPNLSPPEDFQPYSLET